MRILSEEIIKKEGEKVLMSGWVSARRDHGKIIFIDLRDRRGITQIVFTPKAKEIYEEAQKLRPEWVIEIEGIVGKRPKGMENPELPNGELEIQVERLAVLNTSETLPLPIDNAGYDINENTRLQYRYLDLRRRRLLKNLEQRHKIIQFARNFLSKEGFIEIETPILGKSTPEGARDYLVPSRTQSGKFYALPQSPQQYKQLLMVAGMERYFQVARCFRDEDTRGDRQPEFTQLDLEMSFVTREDVMDINERALIEIVKNFYPDKKIQEMPFPRLTYQEAMKKYKSDRPDLRKDKNDPSLLAFCWVIDFPFFEKTDEDGSGKPGWTFTHNPFSAPKPEYMQDLLEHKNIGDILTTQYDIVLNGFEIGGGSIRNHRPEALQAVFEIMGYKKERIKSNFGHMLESFSYGAPPHGGIAWGLDRLVAILQNEPNIREVITFPKTGDGRDLMMGAPSEVDEKQLRELHLKIK
ncbi:MAG: aspartate--tRNA ligase [Patescibacteria group bacterium]|nr:aspartate--tRNA ligase [Patescibacteria group bacterium]